MKGIVVSGGGTPREVKKHNEIIDKNVPFYLGKSRRRGRMVHVCVHLDKNGLSVSVSQRRKQASKPPQQPECRFSCNFSSSELCSVFIMQCHFFVRYWKRMDQLESHKM